MVIFAVSEVSAYSGYNYSKGCYEDGGNCITYLRSIDEVVIMDEIFRRARRRARIRGSGTISSRDVRRYKATPIYDFRNRDIAQVINIEYVKDDQLSVIVFNKDTVFPENFNPYSEMSCNQLNNTGDILCFYRKATED